MKYNKWVCVANMTSVVFCDDDGEANFVEHFYEGQDLKFSMTGEEVGKGYYRGMLPNDVPIILFFDDWSKGAKA
tara:strand:+ start:1143 stop:1364 length:222 start_codon:yes stop_codon:yes gene_type:complete